jgi:DNA-binding transcriptional regulator YdaS (Cro superfamily)
MQETLGLTGIQKAVKAAGGIRPLAKLLGINKDVVRKSQNRGWLTPKHCVAASQATGVPLHELNPVCYVKAA